MVSAVTELEPLEVHRVEGPALPLAALRARCGRALAEGEVVVVLACGHDAQGELAESRLHPDDRLRAGRYQRTLDRQHFVLGRRLLACLLADGAPLPPWPVHDGGKPRPWAGVHFNLSHAQQWLAMALSRAGPVGIDIEGAAGFERQARVVDRISHPDETAWTGQARPAAGGTLRRLAVWTRKEALLKATGEGMGFDAVRWSSLGLRIAPAGGVDASFGWHSFAPQPCDWLLSVAHRSAMPPRVLRLEMPLTEAVSNT